MIRLVIDGNESDFLNEDRYENLDEIIGVLLKERIPFNRLVENFKVNGEDVTTKNQDRMADLPPEKVSRIEFFTSPLSDALQDTINNAGDYLPRLSEGLRKCAEHYRVGEEIEAHNLFAQCMDGLKWFLEFTEKVVKVLEVDQKKIDMEDKSLEQRKEEFYDSIKELESAQQDEDIVTIADLLEYELAPYIDIWLTLFPDMREKINGKFT